MTRSGSMCCSTPSPPQAGQAPNGLLKENSRGSISGMVKPDTGQANFSEKMRRSGPLWSWIFATFFSTSPCDGEDGERSEPAGGPACWESAGPPLDRFALDLPLSGEGKGESACGASA